MGACWTVIRRSQPLARVGCNGAICSSGTEQAGPCRGPYPHHRQTANTLIVSPDNTSRGELNVAVRQELKANGNLAPEDHTFRVLVQRQDMTGAERSWANHYEINDVVRYTRGSKAIRIEAAAYASVVAINPSENQLTVKKANGNARRGV
jgi:hypothetical protein